MALCQCAIQIVLNFDTKFEVVLICMNSETYVTSIGMRYISPLIASLQRHQLLCKHNILCNQISLPFPLSPSLFLLHIRISNSNIRMGIADEKFNFLQLGQDRKFYSGYVGMAGACQPPSKYVLCVVRKRPPLNMATIREKIYRQNLINWFKWEHTSHNLKFDDQKLDHNCILLILNGTNSTAQ